MQEISGRVKQLASSVHDLSHQLHPSKLEQLGLAAAIRGLCKELSNGHGLAIEFTPGGMPGRISEDAALCLYRIAQEALRNIIKHSGARRAAVELSGGADAVELRIADDGAGFDPRLADGKGGLGLREHARTAAPGRGRDRHRLASRRRNPDRSPRAAGRRRDCRGSLAGAAVRDRMSGFPICKGGQDEAPARLAGGRSPLAAGGVHATSGGRLRRGGGRGRRPRPAGSRRRAAARRRGARRGHAAPERPGRRPATQAGHAGDQADFPDHERGRRRGGGGVAHRRVRLPAQELGRLGAATGHPGGLPGAIVRHAAGRPGAGRCARPGAQRRTRTAS